MTYAAPIASLVFLLVPTVASACPYTGSIRDFLVCVHDEIDRLTTEVAALTARPAVCPEGWWSLGGERTCMEPAVREALSFHDDAMDCASSDAARVCVMADMYLACAEGLDPYEGAVEAWLGDVPDRVQQMVWQEASSCDDYPDTDSPHVSEIYPYRCCL